MAETLDHLALKRLAIAWLWRLGCRVVATEVRCPIGRYRIDVAGWIDRPIDGLLDRAPAAGARTVAGGELWSAADASRRSPSRGPDAWRTIIIECKQARADFVRDGADPDALVRERERLDSRRLELERTMVPRYEPTLRREGSSLFAELEEWDYGKSRLAGYRKVLRELQRIDAALYGATKFSRFARYRLADRLVLFAPAGMIRRREIPIGWGLVECDRRPLRREKASIAQGVDPLGALPLRETHAAPPLASHPSRRDRLYRSIALAASREAVRRLAPEALTSAAGEGDAEPASDDPGSSPGGRSDGPRS